MWKSEDRSQSSSATFGSCRSSRSSDLRAKASAYRAVSLALERLFSEGNRTPGNWAWCYLPIVPGPRRPKKDLDSTASLWYRTDIYLKTTTNKRAGHTHTELPLGFLLKKKQFTKYGKIEEIIHIPRLKAK